MSHQSCLLRDEASTITALKDLPTELFPPVFMEAFYGRYSETLKAMVQAWPFVRLPLGGLMKVPHLGTLQAVLAGLDILLAQKDHPRCLTTPLDNLAITHCLLSDSDLSHLSQCPNISQLKGLDLSGITLTYSSPELLPVLLEKVAATLQELYLEQCGIMDSHLETILQPLSHCSQLMFFSLRGNLISMAVMEKLLRHTSGLPSLSQELYPVPQESYSSQRILQPGRLAQCRAELFEVLRVLGHPRIIWISSSPCLHCGDNTFSHPQPIIYLG
uniref:PRAME family member 12-like n=1 Tax=Monodon monoceros TaxID=40151 RepID=A0A8C6AXV6_MONMO